MNGSGTRNGMGWGARLLVALVLILVGASAAVWGLAHYRPAAQFLGVSPAAPQPSIKATKPLEPNAPAVPAPVEKPASRESERIASLENRFAEIQNATQRAEGSAGRADALVVAFAARRAIDRGVALGYLESLLVDRFGAQHQTAVATIITASHLPVRLNDLIDEFQTLGPDVKSGGPQDSWWTNFRRQLGSIVEIHRSDRPAVNVDARYNRAFQRLSSGDVDQALAETMRLPGAARAGAWATRARRYIAAHRALDEIESAALLTGPAR